MENNENKITVMPMVPLRGLVAFPKIPFHFEAGRKKTVIALNQAMQKGQKIFLLTQKDDNTENPLMPNDFYQIGVVAQVQQMMRVSKDTLHVVVQCEERAKVVSVEQEEPFFAVQVSPIYDVKPFKDQHSTALLRTLSEKFKEYTENANKDEGEMYSRILRGGDSSKIANYIASTLNTLPTSVLQKLMEKEIVEDRIEELLVELENENMIEKLGNELQEKVKQHIDKNQRDYYLREQMHVISEELGEGDSPVDDAEEYRKKIESFNLMDTVKEKLLKECGKLAKMPSSSHEAAVIRSYLDLCVDMPWNTFTTDRIDLERSAKILDKEHYGLEKVKERILELLAVRKLQPDVKGQIICLVGPPGVGKTSIARSVAQAMKRKYVRVSLGGVRDESEIRGHRRTYIGSMPGRIIDAIKQAGVSNPLILLDEIDKLAGDFRGDPAAALLEVLDAEQNFSFMDHYLDVPYDLSKVLFLTTANDESAIPAPLLDRMEIIHISGYTREEKFQIAKRHLVPTQMKRNGLDKRRMKLSDQAIELLISGYTREAGVRGLEKNIASLCRKTAKKLVSEEVKSVTINESVVEEMLGPIKYKNEDIMHSDEVGVTNGLAWTAVGGEILQIEIALMEGTGKLELTGSLGDVMKESAKIAVSCVRTHAKELDIDPDFYKKYDIHIHAPEGAVPKDGPSAGVTMATTLVSALKGVPVRGNVAMTGEITLRGRVLPIGGLKEKAMAAYCNQIDTVIIPKQNESNLAEIDAVVRDNVKFVPADSIRTVLNTALKDFSWGANA